MTEETKTRTTTKLSMLSALYFIEGLPWGFQSKALPVFLRTSSASLTVIGLLNLLSIPWMTKVLWAPLVDRYGSRSFGRRKSWIIPIQIALTLTCLAAAWVTRSSGAGLARLLLLILLMNLFSATMDIAVDGMAVDVLRADELGTGNIAQVVGYKFGTLTSGGLLVWATGQLGWPALFVAMAALIAGVCLVTLLFREPPPPVVADVVSGLPGSKRASDSIGAIVELLIRAVEKPGTVWLFLFIATYKTGEQLVDSMFKPFLIDAGFTPAQVGLWVSTFGMAASITGSFIGGLAASRWPLLPAVGVASALRVLPLIAIVLLTMSTPTPTTIVSVAMAENFFGGGVTTIMFAFMMSRTDKRIGATHFTLLSTIEMLGKALVPLAAGPIAQHYGYTVTFGLGALVSLLYLGLLLPLRANPEPQLKPVA